MTQPQQSFAPFDASNPLLAHQPAKLETGSIDTPAGGRLGFVTMRTASTTCTAFATAAEIREWAKLLTELSGNLGSGGGGGLGSGGLATASALDLAELRDLRRPKA